MTTATPLRQAKDPTCLHALTTKPSAPDHFTRLSPALIRCIHMRFTTLRSAYRMRRLALALMVDGLSPPKALCLLSHSVMGCTDISRLRPTGQFMFQTKDAVDLRPHF